MDITLFLHHLRESTLEDGCASIEAQLAELTNHSAIGNLLADEALRQLYNPFLSLKLSELLIFFGDITGDVSAHALGLKAKGDVLMQISHYQAAIESLDAAGAEFLQLEDEGNWARSRISWMIASAWLGYVEEAIRAATAAREIFQRQGERYWVCVIDHNTAVIYSHIGRYADALEMYESTLRIYPTLADQSETFIARAIALARMNIGINLARLGKFEAAYGPLQQAQESFLSLGETSQRVNTEIHLAELDYARGYYGSALRRYYAVSDMIQQNDVTIPIVLTELKLQMAHALLKLNRLAEACTLAYEGVELCRKQGSSLWTSNALCDYATTLVASGRLEEAVSALYEAETLFDRGGFEHHVSAMKLQQAEIRLAMGSAAEAYEESSRLHDHFAARGLGTRAVHARLVMVGSLLALAEQTAQTANTSSKEQQSLFLQEARTLCKQVALQARQYHLQEEVYKSQHLLGRIGALQGEMTKASGHFGAAIVQIERMLDDFAFDLSPAFLRSAWAVYEDMIALCLTTGKTELAFHYLERARSMALHQYMNTSDENTARQAHSTQRDELHVTGATKLRLQHELIAWQKEYRDYSTLLAQIDTSVSPTVEREVIEAELRRCEAKMSELFERLHLLQSPPRPTYRGKKTQKRAVQHLDVAQLRAQLLPDSLNLAYFLYKGKLVIFALTKDQLITHEIPHGMQQVQRQLLLLHAHLQPGGWPNAQQPPSQGIRHMLHKLYALLIAPIQALLPPRGGHLTIIPYGFLHTLPFHALYNGSRFLVEDYSVSYLPASNLLSRLKSPAEALSADQQPLPTACRRPLVFGYSGHGHLQHALAEAQTVATLLGGRCHLEQHATTARLIEEAPGSPIIHLATHGHSRLDAPNFSSVLLADGPFNALDAFSLDLKGCELVTLSGCETGLALSGGGDEQLGLGRAFLAAGTNTLVMSLWPVADHATNELMQLFYSNLLQGKSKVQALNTAQCTLLHRSTAAGSDYTHPYYWAAFRLVGEIGPLKFRSS